ncbi:MAG: hypothetical protein Ct9H300mP15_30400 [Gemmatimonadota bacterium]|nr:MAG: hypothetical protein Ct9H300mP15_30400 [Gemmatimonadota bacterium]
MERFIELGGGAEEGRFVIVPTAGGNYAREGNLRMFDEDRVLASWRERGVMNVSMLHTHDAKLADTEAFSADLCKRRPCGSTGVASGTSSTPTRARARMTSSTRYSSAEA